MLVVSVHMVFYTFLLTVEVDAFFEGGVYWYWILLELFVFSVIGAAM